MSQSSAFSINWRMLPAMLFVALALVLVVGLYSPKAKLFAASTMEGKSMPQLATRPLEGFKPVNQAALEGKPYVVNMFASWCTPCRQEHPMIKHMADSGIPVIGIAWQDKPEEVKKWFAKDGNPYTMLGMDEGGKSALALGITGVPESFVVDANGVIVFHLAGPLDKNWIQQHVAPYFKK
jgi:cytochrome c biogenesis protein CcmG/thiol:disulfide interchange protein DsbE